MKQVLLISALLAIAIASAQAGEWARADIFSVNPAEKSMGTSFAEFTWNENDNTTTIHVRITGITTNPDSDHGIHIHTFGDLSAVNGTSFGPHWDPEGKDHGCIESSENYAAGDLGNWTATGGIIDETKTFSGLELSGVRSIIGRGIVLHATADNCAVVSSAGARLAGGVIGVKNVANNLALPTTNLTAPYLAVCTLSATTTGAPLGINGSFYWVQATATSGVTAAGTIGRTAEVGVHVHQFGDLSAADGTATGGHFDPLGTGHHDLPNGTEPHHAGDMGNTDPSNIINSQMWFSGSYPRYYMSVLGTETNVSIIGRGFIVHNQRDDASQPTGNAGARGGQCVIGIGSRTLTAVRTLPTKAPSASASTLSFSAVVAVIATVVLALAL